MCVTVRREGEEGGLVRVLWVNGTATTRLYGVSRLDLQGATREILGEAWRGVAGARHDTARHDTARHATPGVPPIVCA